MEVFFEKGKLLKTYRVEDLVDFVWLLPRSVSHFEWEKEVSMDYEQNRLTIKTLLYDVYIFDTSTGEIISSTRYSRIAFGVIFATIIYTNYISYKLPTKK